MLELLKLVQKWERTAAKKFKDAEHEDTFGKRFIEHGAMCYYNCAQDLKKTIESWDSGLGFDFQILKEDSK